MQQTLRQTGWLLLAALFLLSCGRHRGALDEHRLITNPNAPNILFTLDPSARCSPLRENTSDVCQSFHRELVELEERVAASNLDGHTLRVVGVMSYYGLWLKQDNQQARTALAASCKTYGDQLGCVYLDALLIEEKSGSARARAIGSLTKRCIEDQPDACELLAISQIVYTREELAAQSQELLGYCEDETLTTHVGACLAGLTFLRQVDEVLAYPSHVQVLERKLARDPALLTRYLFYMQDANLDEFARFELRGSVTDQQQELMRSVAMLQDLLNDLLRVLESKVSPWSVLAHVTYVTLLHDFADLLENAPMPQGLNSDQARIWEEQWKTQNGPLIRSIGDKAEALSAPTMLELFSADTRGYWAYAKLYRSWD
ncbi:MAG: hypothetical protein VYE40_14680 [Myxococcota bacterium]|nr:hypothetical protein [Myxococcota bacterium]